LVTTTSSPSHCTCSLFFSSTSPLTMFYPLSLHDALPICISFPYLSIFSILFFTKFGIAIGNNKVISKYNFKKFVIIGESLDVIKDRKSTRLNSSHVKTSYAVFCLKKKRHHTRA